MPWRSFKKGRQKAVDKFNSSMLTGMEKLKFAVPAKAKRQFDPNSGPSRKISRRGGCGGGGGASTSTGGGSGGGGGGGGQYGGNQNSHPPRSGMF
jgi:hypothetical protein